MRPVRLFDRVVVRGAVGPARPGSSVVVALTKDGTERSTRVAWRWDPPAGSARGSRSRSPARYRAKASFSASDLRRVRREVARRRHPAPPSLVGIRRAASSGCSRAAGRPQLPSRRDQGRPVRLPNRRRGRRVPQGAAHGSIVHGERGDLAQARRPDQAACTQRLERLPLRGRPDEAGPLHGGGRRRHERAPRLDRSGRHDARRQVPRLGEDRRLQPEPPLLPELLRRATGRSTDGPRSRRTRPATAASGSRTGTRSGCTASRTTAPAS